MRWLKDDRVGVLLFSYTTLVLFLVLAPHPMVQRIRHLIAHGVLKQWSKMSVLSAIIYNFFWQEGNGH